MSTTVGTNNRNRRGVLIIRAVVTAWLLVVAGVLVAYGQWGWALLVLVGAVANVVVAYRVHKGTWHRRT